MKPEEKLHDPIFEECSPLIDQLFEKCTETAPNFEVSRPQFTASLEKTLERFISSAGEDNATADEAKALLEQLQLDDLFLAIACSNGNERAWWEFDQQHRSYLERVARHLAKTEADAQDVIDTVYVELYGTRVIDGERISKFATYSGRGSLRGWLRTVVWHSLVDLHRSGHDEVSLDEMTENVGEGMAHANFAVAAPGGEDEMVEMITTDRYRTATIRSMETAFGSLETHERLLLMYYHVNNLKLREISALVEDSDSPLRGWFQRRSKRPSGNTRTHESTVMRWLEKCYAKIFQQFREELQGTYGLSSNEVETCMELATQDLAGGDIFRNLSAI
ncbi:MAG: hypothetical protein KF855_13065 [Acidobacteria bacterium]|nr:hypothetical protein [Acidobacteriota bacterium]